MFTYEELHKKVADYINSLNFSSEPYGLYQPIKYTLDTGGKRLRPVLALMAANMFTNDLDSVMSSAIALEVFHNFTLLHDDLMDNADIRRKMPTVHKKWSANTAILSGDAMMIKAFQLINETKSSEKNQIIEIFNQTALEVCEGQQYDMNFEERIDVSENEYINMIRLKTSVLLAACLKIGAVAAGATKSQSSALYNVGVNMGLSFQLQDDYLDTFGNVEIFGKNIGGDIRANKKTYLLIKALELAKGEQLQQLKTLISTDEVDSDEKVKLVTQIYKDLDIEQLVRVKIKKYNDLAISELSGLDVDDDKKTFLLQLINKLTNRSF